MASLATVDIRNLIRFRGDFRNTIRFPDAAITNEMQGAFAEFWEIVADTNEGYWDTQATVPTVAGTQFVTNPTDLWRLRGLDRLEGSDFIELAQIGVSERNSFSSTNDKPRAYRLSSRGIELYPTPDAIYSLRVTYTPTATLLTDDDGVTVNYYNGWEEYVIYGTLIRLAENEERDISEWQARLDRQVARIKAGASGRKSAEPEYLNLRQGWGDDINDERWR